MNKLRTYLTCILLGAIMFALALGVWIFPSEDVLRAERRQPSQMPEVTAHGLLDNDGFTDGFESFLLDRFPARQNFRRLKSTALYGVFMQSDNNGIYVADGQVSKLTVSYRDISISRAASKISRVVESLPEGVNAYLSLIPDKNYYLSEENGYPTFDYETFRGQLYDGLPERVKRIDLFGALTIDDYYRTDTHWNQRCLGRVVAALEEGMDLPSSNWNYEEHDLDGFYGVYFGQAALPLEAETLTYLTNEDIDNATVEMISGNTGQFEEAAVYDLEDYENVDPYDVFLAGPQALIRITNPDAATDRRLILFRDSYGSSLTPLLIGDYSEIVMVDLRYINFMVLDNYVTIESGDDVLFLYSAMSIINSDSMLVF